MYKWCEAYPANGPFERFHIVRNYRDGWDMPNGDIKEVPLIQFESRKAAYLFRIAFSEYIIANRTYNFAKEWLDEPFDR
jgi:hypothetical protein